METFLILKGDVDCLGHQGKGCLIWMVTLMRESNSEWGAHFSQRLSDAFGTVWGWI